MPTNIDKYLDPTGLDETVLNIRQIAEGLEADMQDLPYARPDGLYPDMTVGAVIGADETAQWATRESTGTGSAIVRSVQGAAVAWNQLARQLDVTESAKGTTCKWQPDGTAVINGTVDSSGAAYQLGVANVQGHKYLVKGTSSGVGSAYFGVGFGSDINGTGVIATSSSSALTVYYSIFFTSASVGTTLQDFTLRPQIFDLTAMFGSGNEPQSVAEFEAMYPEAYYPYSAPTLKPVQIAGIASTDAQGGELDAIEWTAQTLRAAGSVADMLYADHVDVKVGAVDLGMLTWVKNANYGYYTADISTLIKRPADVNTVSNIFVVGHTPASWNTLNAGGTSTDNVAVYPFGGEVAFSSDAATAADFKAAMNGVLLYYELATPTTTPISPALPMSYQVQQGGSESIIVPDGEVSAAPVLTVAEPVNMSTELARIWAAIEQLQSRGTAQLSRTDTVSIDEVQKDTAEKDTTKEVTE